MKMFENERTVVLPWGGGGGGQSLIWPKWVCAVQQGMVFRVLHLKQGIEFQYLVS